MQATSQGRAFRRFNDIVAIKRQVKIAKAHDAATPALLQVEAGRFRKHHAMDCGNTNCGLCSNARRNPHSSGTARLTKQERVHLERLRAGINEVLALH